MEWTVGFRRSSQSRSARLDVEGKLKVMNYGPGKRIAVYFDLENVSPQCILEVLSQLTSAGWDPCIRRAYGIGLAQWRELLRSQGVMPVETLPNVAGKNASDIALCVDAVQELFCGPVDAFAIVSGDSDYTGLALKIRESGRPVFVFGSVGTPGALRMACTDFFELRGNGSGKKSQQRKNCTSSQGQNFSGRHDGNGPKDDGELRTLVDDFLATSNKGSLTAFIEFVRQRDPYFRTRKIISRLKRLGACALLPCRNAGGEIETYELAIGAPDSAVPCAARALG